MKYIWLILLGLMILGFAGASFFSNSLLIPSKPGPAELIIPKAASPEKQPESSTPSVTQRQQPVPVARERRPQQNVIDHSRFRKLPPLVVRRIPVDPSIRAAVESSVSADQTRVVRSNQPVTVVDPYDPNCNPDRDICAGAKSKSRPRRVESAPPASDDNQSSEKKTGILNAIKKVIPGANKTP